MSEDFRDPNKAVDFIVLNAEKMAAAKADRVQLEEFRKSKKALLMNESTAKTVSDRETYAYSHPEYQQLLDGLKAAVYQEERLKWLLRGAELRVDVWRSQNANARVQDRATT
jgi:hypothetical protein